MTIWGRYNNGKKEKIDTTSTKREANYLVGEYQLAFGKGWKIWVGKEENKCQDTMYS